MELICRAYFKMLLEEEDRESFNHRIATAAGRLCRMQVPFDHLALAFHVMEDCCLPFIKQVYPEKEKLVEAMVAMDYMCHACFSVIAESYFHEKYAHASSSPQREKHSIHLAESRKLTHRETQVLKRIVEGYKNREIADLLKISVKTVEHHRASLMRKLGVNNAVNLTKLAIRNQIV
ncbi:MAG: response regulator transcription factor [Nitrospirae bacterium]|nr:response regulator transcription factor [Nitrospirota bacterium]